MSKFFINRPIVAMVISILMVIIGVVAMVQLPIAQFPELAPPEILLQATYVGADAPTPRAIGRHADRAADERRRQHALHDFAQRQQPAVMQAAGGLRRRHESEHRPGAHADALLAGGVPASRSTCATMGVTVRKSPSSPLALFSLYSPNGTYDALSSPTTPTSTSTIR